MPYSKQTWVDNNLSYPVSAARMGAIENGIEAAASVADTAYALAQVFPNRNRITNGTMQIDQRRGGTAVTNTAYAYAADRFVFYTPSTPGTVNLQQVVDGPPGVSQYSSKLTVNIVDSSITAAERYGLGTGMEGLEIADLAWGTANARPIVVSFYVKSSLTGTHPFCLGNGDFSRSYVVNFTVNAANTWERKSFVVPGDQSGTWLATNALALNIEWSMGRGSNFQTATLGAWQTGNYKASTTALNLIATAGATFQITGVQLEASSTVTPFEYRPYTDELLRCKRYYQRNYVYGGGAVGGGTPNVPIVAYNFFPPMRVAPTATWISGGIAMDGTVDYNISSLNSYRNGTVDGIELLYVSASAFPANARGVTVRAALTEFFADIV